MSEQTSRDEAMRVGAEAITHPDSLGHPITNLQEMAQVVLDAAHKARLISYQDEWEQVGWHCWWKGGPDSRGRLIEYIEGDDERLVLTDELPKKWRLSEKYQPIFRRVSFEAGEEVNEEQADVDG